MHRVSRDDHVAHTGMTGPPLNFLPDLAWTLECGSTTDMATKWPYNILCVFLYVLNEIVLYYVYGVICRPALQHAPPRARSQQPPGEVWPANRRKINPFGTSRTADSTLKSSKYSHGTSILARRSTRRSAETCA